MPIYKTPGAKDGKQKYRVRINYTDRNGAPHQLTRIAYGNTEAKQLEAALRREYADGNDGPGRLTVRDLYEQYMETKLHEVRRSTYEKSRRSLEANVLPILGDVRLDRLNAQTLQAWKNQVASKNISARSQRNIYSELRAMLNYGLRLEYFARNPLLTVGNFKDKDFTSQKDRLHYYTSEQFVRYITVARQEAERRDTLADWGYYVFFAIAYYTGLRKGEINALKWSDIEGNILNVRRSVTQKVKGEGIVETPPKNKTSYRTLQIPLPLLDILREQYNRCLTIEGFCDNFRVCGGEQCLSDTAIENRNTLFARKADLPHIRIHDFRHSHASLLANEGINIQEIARRLGHSKIEQTWNTYAHLYPREEERAIQVLNRVKS